MQDVMIDLETRGNTPGSIILSIGAVGLDRIAGRLSAATFYEVINSADCAARGLHEDASTMAWWNDQSEAARQVLHESEISENMLIDTLRRFSTWAIQNFGLDMRIWGCGASFDEPIMVVAYGKCDLKVPWKFWNSRCYRTLKEENPRIKMTRRQGTHHNALDDAKSQAIHALQIWGHKGPFEARMAEITTSQGTAIYDVTTGDRFVEEPVEDLIG